MDNIIKHIYTSCDPNNINQVPTSSLVDFIKPYMPENLNELHELQKQLDPDNTDRCISSSFFEQIMSDWIAKIKEKDLSNSLSEISNNSVGASGDSSNGQSVNMSSKASNNNNIIAEEQVQQLQYQLQKTVNELELVKQQLAVSEEQNESLASDLSKLQKQHWSRDQQLSEEFSRSKLENDEIKEEAETANKRIQHLSKIISNLEKENEALTSQNTQLENENSSLKEKIAKCEKLGVERRKSISDFKDELDVKDAEIASLMEIIESLQAKLEEKTELVSFYTKENKFLKQKALALENLFQDVFPEGASAETPKPFNTPKLMHQLAHPISPSLSTTPSTSVKKYSTSSPIQGSRISPFRGMGASVDLFTTGIVTVLRSPHQTLKDELSQASSDSLGDHEEVKRLQDVLKEQESIKRSLWENMKDLSNDNKALHRYKKSFEDLLSINHEKDETIQRLQEELAASVSQNCISSNDLSRKADKSTETNQFSETEIEKKDESVETDKDEEIRRLETDLLHEKSMNTELRKKIEKTVAHKTTETDDIWNIPLDVPHNKKTNYSKLQMKLERLVERQEKIEKELANERGINTTLTLKLQQLREENKRNTDNLNFLREKTRKQKEVIASLLSDKRDLSAKLEMLEVENEGILKENVGIKEAMRTLTNEKHNLNQSLQNALNRLAVESAIANNVRAENDHLAHVQRQYELRLTEECIKEIHLKKQVMDLKANQNSIITDLQKQLVEKNNEVEKMKREVELTDIVDAFFSGNNRELRRINQIVLNRFKTKFDNALDHNLIYDQENSQKEENFNLESDMVMLKNNIKLAVHLLKIFASKYEELAEQQQNTEIQHVESSTKSELNLDTLESLFTCQANSTPNEDSFTSCFSEISISVREYLDGAPLDFDSFLDSLELNEQDLRKLSTEELEAKFTSLALNLTVDFSSSNKRYFAQKEKFNGLLVKFFTYLNYSIQRMGQHEQNPIQKTVITYLKLLKDISEDAFKAAVQCGVLQYEKRTINCWNLVINYVAALSQGSKQIKNNGSEDRSSQVTSITHQIQTNETKTEPPSLPRLPVFKKIKCFVSVFFLILFVLFFILVVYVDSLCPKDRLRVCPIEWILSRFVEKIHTHSPL